MSVKAKFRCSSVSGSMPVTPGALATLIARFHAVYGKDGENADYAEATPSGYLELTINGNRPAASYFKHGRDYFLTFEEAPEEHFIQ